MKDRIAELLKIKSLWSLCVMIVFTILALTERLDIAVTSSVISSIITYYFTKKENKKE